MSTDSIKLLAEHNIFAYGSAELLKFERQMEKYFKREYDRWEGNKALPEIYGANSFEGRMVDSDTHDSSIDAYNDELKIYQSFLDSRYMAYTMAFYGATDSHPSIDKALTLELAQQKKYQLIADRADIQDGQIILDLGCGFGGFIKYLLQTYPNVKIIAINPSSVQAEYIEHDSDIDASRCRLIKKYIDEVTSEDVKDATVDRVISIGVLEHFLNLELLFYAINRMLKTGGKSFHHFIVSIDTIPQFLNAGDTLMSEYFPGGHIWPFNEAKRHNKYLKCVDSWFVNGLNYWKTLDDWHCLFWQNIDSTFPSVLSVDDVERWNKYFSLCKTMFSPNKGNSYGNGHYLYLKE